MTTSIYEKPLDSAALEFTRPCGCNQGNDNDESCVIVAAIPGVDGEWFALGDSKNAAVNGAIRMSGNELDEFATAWVQQRGLTVA